MGCADRQDAARQPRSTSRRPLSLWSRSSHFVVIAVIRLQARLYRDPLPGLFTVIHASYASLGSDRRPPQ